VRAGDRQRLDLVADLAGDAEDLSAGGQHPQQAAGREQVGDELGGLGDHVLAVVDQQQTVQLARRVAEAVTHGARRLRADAECPRQRVGDQVGGGNGSEVGQAHTVGKAFGARCGHLQRETGLPRASRAGQREQPMALEQRGDLVCLALSADEAGQREGQDSADLHCPADLRAHLDEGRPVGDAELTQQGADVAFNRPHRDVQAVGDLAVVQALGDGRQDVGFAFGNAGPGQPLRWGRRGGGS
jgi:hypothetical protein